jgi:hypothetical protein
MDINKIEQELIEKRKNLEELKKGSSLITEKEKIELETKQLETNIQKANLRAKHPKLFGFTKSWEGGIKRIWKALGKGLKVAAEKGNQADSWIAKEQAKEREQSKPETKKKNVFEQAGDIDT